jgi:hypothetical protein
MVATFVPALPCIGEACWTCRCPVAAAGHPGRHSWACSPATPGPLWHAVNGRAGCPGAACPALASGALTAPASRVAGCPAAAATSAAGNAAAASGAGEQGSATSRAGGDGPDIGGTLAGSAPPASSAAARFFDEGCLAERRSVDLGSLAPAGCGG